MTKKMHNQHNVSQPIIPARKVDEKDKNKPEKKNVLHEYGLSVGN